MRKVNTLQDSGFKMLQSKIPKILTREEAMLSKFARGPDITVVKSLLHFPSLSLVGGHLQTAKSENVNKFTHTKQDTF